MDFLNVFIYVAVFLILIYLFFKWKFQYWKNHNVPYLQPSIPFGNAMNAEKMNQNFCEQIEWFYKKFKPTGTKHYGFYMFTSPMYIPMDLDLIKQILIRDFHIFMDRGMYVNERNDPLSAHLFSLAGHKWKNLRNKLTPVFTSGKMKMMFTTLLEVGLQMEKNLNEVIDHREPFDIKDLVSKYTTDVIGSCAFGIDCNSFENPNSDFRKYGRKAFTPNGKQVIKNMLCFFNKKLANILGIIQTDREVSNFFLSMVRDSIKYREENNITRNDFLNILIDLKNVNSDLGTLTVEEIAAQAFLFFVAGFDTSSATMTFCLFELSQNKDVQEKVRQEINSVLAKYNGNVTYDALKEMNYLTNVIDETLRKYPPIPFLLRVCSQSYHVPGTDVILTPEQAVIIPTYAIHRDPEYYPNPEVFDPDRFLEEAKLSRHSCTFLPFGDGPRNCIGLRFGLMQTKVGLATILKNYKVTLNEKTELPLRLDPFPAILSTKQTIWLNAEKAS